MSYAVLLVWRESTSHFDECLFQKCARLANSSSTEKPIPHNTDISDGKIMVWETLMRKRRTRWGPNMMGDYYW